MEPAWCRAVGSASLDQLTTVDSGLDDVLAVLDATGLDRPAVMGVGGGVALAVVLAATHPERVSVLVLADDTSRLGVRRGPRQRRCSLRLGDKGGREGLGNRNLGAGLLADAG